MITQVLVKTFTTRGKTTNSITYFGVKITQVLVWTYTNGASLLVSYIEQGGATEDLVLYIKQGVYPLFLPWAKHSLGRKGTLVPLLSGII